jgi:hypothetical protein
LRLSGKKQSIESEPVMAKKSGIVTFKVDGSLLEALKGVPNRSDFIRSALMAALDNTCPVCKGTGLLTQCQKDHWNEFIQHHSVEECSDCATVHLICELEGTEEAEAS